MRLVDDDVFTKLALTLTAFFSEDMAFPSLFSLNFTGTGNFKAFAYPTVRFHLWHNETPI